MSVEVVINGNKMSFPTQVEDVTLKQFFALRKATNAFEEISAVTGIPLIEIQNFSNVKSLNNAIALMNVLADDIEKGFDSFTLPKFVFIGTKRVTIPKQLDLEPIGAYMSVHSLLAIQQNKLIKEGKTKPDFTDCIPMTLAHYFYRAVNPDGMYSDEAAEHPDYVEKIMQLTIDKAMPIANFFFLKFPNLT